MTGKIPVSTARFIAKKHKLKQCLLIGWDGEFVHVVTYGETPDDCAAAAKAQDFWTGKIREFSFKGDEEPANGCRDLTDEEARAVRARYATPECGRSAPTPASSTLTKARSAKSTAP